MPHNEDKELKELLSEFKQDLLDEIINSKTELKHFIEASETKLSLKVEDLKQKVNSLEKDNQQLKDKIERLERESKKKNLVVFGLQIPPKERNVDVVCSELNRLLNTEINHSDIINIYSLGKSDTAPLKLEIISQIKRQEILKNRKNIKDNKLKITHDFTELQRKEYKILREYLTEARKINNQKSYIKGNKLYVGNLSYTIDELETLDHNFEEEKTRANSAPLTPTPLEEKIYIAEIENPTSSKIKPVSVQQEEKKTPLPHQTPKQGKNSKGPKVTQVDQAKKSHGYIVRTRSGSASSTIMNNKNEVN